MTIPKRSTPEDLEHYFTILDDVIGPRSDEKPLALLHIKDHISALEFENGELRKPIDLHAAHCHMQHEIDTLNSTIQRLEQDRLQSDRIIANEKKNSDRLFSECEELKKELLTLTTQMAGIAKACKQVDDVRIEEINQLRAQCSTMLAQAVTPNTTVLEWIEPVIELLRRLKLQLGPGIDGSPSEFNYDFVKTQLSRLTTIKSQLEKAK